MFEFQLNLSLGYVMTETDTNWLQSQFSLVVLFAFIFWFMLLFSKGEKM